MDICFQVVLFQTEKSFKSSSLLYIYIFFLFHSSCLFEFQFFSFLTFSFCFLFFLHLFADNVGVWAFLTLHWMWFFLSIYNLQYRGSSQFFQCSCLLIEVLTVCVYACARARVCGSTVRVCDRVCEWVFVRSSLPWHAYLTALSWSSRSTNS